MVDRSIILCDNNHKTGNGTGTGRRTVTLGPAEAGYSTVLNEQKEGKLQGSVVCGL